MSNSGILPDVGDDDDEISRILNFIASPIEFTTGLISTLAGVQVYEYQRALLLGRPLSRLLQYPLGRVNKFYLIFIQLYLLML